MPEECRVVVDQQCPLPNNETQRVAAVRSYHILDTAPSLEFEALTRIASHTFDMPIAVVAIMARLANGAWDSVRTCIACLAVSGCCT